MFSYKMELFALNFLFYMCTHMIVQIPNIKKFKSNYKNWTFGVCHANGEAKKSQILFKRDTSGYFGRTFP